MNKILTASILMLFIAVPSAYAFGPDIGDIISAIEKEIVPITTPSLETESLSWGDFNVWTTSTRCTVTIPVQNNDNSRGETKVYAKYTTWKFMYTIPDYSYHKIGTIDHTEAGYNTYKFSYNMDMFDWKGNSENDQSVKIKYTGTISKKVTVSE